MQAFGGLDPPLSLILREAKEDRASWLAFNRAGKQYHRSRRKMCALFATEYVM